MADIAQQLREYRPINEWGDPVHHTICDEAALEIERLRAACSEACDLLAERTHGSPARSPGHNARLVLEAALHGAPAFTLKSSGGREDA